MARKGYSLGSLTDYVNTKFNISGGEITGDMNVQGILKEKGQRVYSPNNKPTAGDVSAVNKSGDDVDGQLRFTPTYATTTNQAHIFHDCRSENNTPVNIRSMRDSVGATWIWEKVGGGRIYYSSGVNGGGTNKITLNVNEGDITATGNITGATVYAQGSGEPHMRTENTASKKVIQLVSRANGVQTAEIYSASSGWQTPITFRDDGNVEVNDLFLRNGTFAMKGDHRKHINFIRENGTSDGYIYKDIGEPWWINHGDSSPAWWRFTPQGEFIVNAKHWSDTHGHGWVNVETTAPIHLSYDGCGGTSDYYPMLRGRHYIPGKGYNTNFDFGFLRGDPSSVGGWDGAAIIRVAGNESPDNPNANFMFNINGDFFSPRNGNFNDVHIRSDLRLKSKLESIDNALSKVQDLNGYTFDKHRGIGDEVVLGREAGLVAQELETVLPEAVFDNVQGFKVISSSAVNGLLVEAIKELSAKVAELELKLSTK